MNTTYKVALANKIVRGRAVGNLWGVMRYVDGRQGSWAVVPQPSEELARAKASIANKLKGECPICRGWTCDPTDPHDAWVRACLPEE